MYIVFLTFGKHRERAAEFMEAHNAWIRQGLADGVFLLSGSLPPGRGGCVILHGCTEEEAKARVDADPFVAEGVVDAEIVLVTPGKADPRLAFLLPN